MTLKSYLHSRVPQFEEIEHAPIHLVDYDGRHYYAFAEDVTPPSGGKAVSDDELKDVLEASLLFRQIKSEAKKRITAIASSWRQQNALVDILMLQGRQSLTEEEKDDLAKAQNLLQEVQKLRQRSNEIETSFLEGIEIDYLTDQAWEEL